jgi:hypothetical protein
MHESLEIGGRGGIRTHGSLATTSDFESDAFNHSATLPAVLLADNCVRRVESENDYARISGCGKRIRKPAFAASGPDGHVSGQGWLENVRTGQMIKPVGRRAFKHRTIVDSCPFVVPLPSSEDGF